MGRTLFLNHPIHFVSPPPGTPVELIVPASAPVQRGTGDVGRALKARGLLNLSSRGPAFPEVPRSGGS